MKCDYCIYAIERIYYGGTTATFCLKKKEYPNNVQKCSDFRIIKECQNCDYFNGQITMENSKGLCERTKNPTDECDTCKYFKEHKNENSNSM